MPEKKAILIVDDDKTSAVLLKTELEAKGYAVDYVENGEIALKLLAQQVPDLMLLDIVMPGVDGFTLARKMKSEERTKDIPIIITSARTGMKELFAMEGITDYIVKPINVEQLLELIRKRLG